MDVIVTLARAGARTFRVEHGTTSADLLAQAVAAFEHTSPCELVFAGELLEPTRVLQRVLGCLVSGPTYQWHAQGFRLEAPGTGRRYVDGKLVSPDTPIPDFDAYPC